MESKNCLMCNSKFETIYINKKKFCCRKCKDKYKSKIYRENNKEKLKIYQKQYLKSYMKSYYERNRDLLNQINKKSYENNKDNWKQTRIEYQLNNQERIKQIKQVYNQIPENKIKFNNIQKASNKIRRKTDILFLIKGRCRCRITQFLKIRNMKKDNSTFKIIGCSPLELKEHLESQFTIGMSWDNKEIWHIDHIIPLSSAKSKEEIYNLCHYSNLQPLWAEENLIKGSKLL